VKGTPLFSFLLSLGLLSAGYAPSAQAQATPPTITTQPQDQTVTQGAQATFSVAATGTAPLSYQWSKNGKTIGGANKPSYTTGGTSSGDNGSTFSVQVSNSAGSQTSDTATLTVNTPPKITTQPQNKTVTAGSPVTFSVAASGSAPLNYQWFNSGAAIAGATSPSYTIPATAASDNGSRFTAQVSNAAGSQTSNAANLTVNAPPTISVQPQNQAVTPGATATFSVVASGTGGLNYQWSKNGQNIGGTNHPSYTTPATVASDNGATFTVTVTNSFGSLTSNAATLTVSLTPTITAQPQSQSVALGATATFSVVASGTAPLSYQWYKNGTPIAAATSSSYTTPATVSGDNGSTFSVVVSNSSGSQTSNAATLTVSAPPMITTPPQNQTVTVGATATFSVVASGTSPLSYQWSRNGTVISGATSSSYTTPATVSTDNGATFTVRVSNSAGSQTSSAATLTVNAPPTITTQPQSQIVTAGSTATFSVAASGAGPLSYQWYKNGTAIPGAASASYTTPATVSGDNGATFIAVVSNAGGSTSSNTVTLTVAASAVAPTITTQPQNQTVVIGATATFTVAATGTAPLSYQWSRNGTAIAGATGASYTTPPAASGDNGATFSVLVSNAGGSTPSNTATLTVVTAASTAPFIFQHIASSTNPVTNGITGRAFTFHTESLPANTVAVMGVSAPADVTVTISDTLVGNWSPALCAASGGSGNAQSWVQAWVFAQSLGPTGGPDTITINVGSSNIQPVQFDITFWENISTSSPANGSLCAGDLLPQTGGVISPGSFTPSTNNDANGGNVIWNYTPICIGYASGNPTKWLPASGFSLLNADTIWSNAQGFPEASQYFVQATQASVTPSITASGDTADCFNSASVALKVANNGAAPPSSLHVAAIIHESFITFQAPGTQTFQTPTVGNLRVLGIIWEGGCPGGANQCLGAVSSSDGCKWTVIGMTGGAAGQVYAQNCLPCSTCTTSITYTGSGGSPQASFRLYDIVNAAPNSYQNSAGGTAACGAPTVSDAPGNFTPTGANSGLTIATIGNGNGPLTGLASGSPAATFDLWTFIGQTDSDVADNADGQAHYYYSTPATQTWNWAKQTTNDICYWWAANYN
jgi:hypothetical protein